MMNLKSQSLGGVPSRNLALLLRRALVERSTRDVCQGFNRGSIRFQEHACEGAPPFRRWRARLEAVASQ
eukprot:2322461-Lingulodinium_polyedra.AAC.1